VGFHLWVARAVAADAASPAPAVGLDDPRGVVEPRRDRTAIGRAVEQTVG